MAIFETIHDLRHEAEPLQRRPYGVIEMQEGRLFGIHLRPWPKLISLPEVTIWGRGFHRRKAGDRCLLYYNQPRRARRFLALKYVVSSRHCCLRTFRGATIILDEIARLKGCDAIVCEVTNLRISDRLLDRWGWQRHLTSSRRRHFIKRFYGQYLDPTAARALAGNQDQPANRSMRPRHPC